MSFDQELEVEAYYLMKQIKESENSDEWNYKGGDRDFYAKYFDKMEKLLKKFASRYWSGEDD